MTPLVWKGTNGPCRKKNVKCLAVSIPNGVCPEHEYELRSQQPQYNEPCGEGSLSMARIQSGVPLSTYM